MHSTPRPAKSRQAAKWPMPTWKNSANLAIAGSGGLLLFAAGALAVQSHQMGTYNAQAAASYKPAVTYTPPAEPTKVAFLGDSFTAGSGATSRANRWTALVSQERGWLELNYGVGGTNYATGSPSNNGAPYADRLDDLIISDPDIIVVSSAGNLIHEDQQPGIETTFKTLREELPDARIVATSPYTRAGEFPDNLVEFGKEIETEVEAVSGEYLEIGHPLGDHPEAMADDGAHPNDAGYKLIAEAVQDVL